MHADGKSSIWECVCAKTFHVHLYWDLLAGQLRTIKANVTQVSPHNIILPIFTSGSKQWQQVYQQYCASKKKWIVSLTETPPLASLQVDYTSRQAPLLYNKLWLLIWSQVPDVYSRQYLCYALPEGAATYHSHKSMATNGQHRSSSNSRLQAGDEAAPHVATDRLANYLTWFPDMKLVSAVGDTRPGPHICLSDYVCRMCVHTRVTNG